MAGLPWVKIDALLPTHPKTIHLGALLDDDGAALAALVKLWLWASQNAPTGNITGPAASRVIERAVGWAGEKDKLTAALFEAGWLDGLGEGYAIHDWADHHGGDIAKAQADSKRRADSRTTGGQPEIAAESPRTSAGHPRIAAGRRGKTETETEIKNDRTVGAEIPPTLAGFIGAVQAVAGNTGLPTDPVDTQIDAHLARVGHGAATEYVVSAAQASIATGNKPRFLWKWALTLLESLPAKSPPKPRDKQRDENEAARVLAQSLRDLSSSLPEAQASALAAELAAVEALEDWGEVQTQRAAVLAKWRKAAA